MLVELSTRIEAPAPVVWSILSDVEAWPEWTQSMTTVQRLDVGYFGAGSRVRIKQPRFPAAVWLVTQFSPGRSFIWKSKAFGLTSEACHAVEPASGASDVTLVLTQTGFLAGLTALLYGSRVRRYVRMELEGLKKASEAAGV
jgi:uncharacterized membrane protein